MTLIICRYITALYVAVAVPAILASAAVYDDRFETYDADRYGSTDAISQGWGAGPCVEDDYCVVAGTTVIVRVHTDRVPS